MHATKLDTGAAAVIAAGALIGTGAALSGAATDTAATATPSPTTSASAGQSGGHVHTPVTGGELAEVTAAVKAKDSAVTVTTVQKDPDGSYDVDGTKAGTPVHFDVSADLRTITARTGGKGAATPGDTGTSTTSATSAVI